MRSSLSSAVVTALVLVVGACGSKPKEASTAIPPGQAWLSPQQIKDSKIDVTSVGMHGVGGAIVTSGRVTFDDLRVSHVFSPVSGRITKILANPGQRVKKDQSLCVIVSPDLGQAFSDLAKGEVRGQESEDSQLGDRERARTRQRGRAELVDRGPRVVEPRVEHRHVDRAPQQARGL